MVSLGSRAYAVEFANLPGERAEALAHALWSIGRHRMWAAATLEETAFVPQALPRVATGAAIMLRLEAGTHYLQRVIVGANPPGPAIEYIFAEDDSLRSVPLPGGRAAQRVPPGWHRARQRARRALAVLADGCARAGRDAAVGAPCHRFRRPAAFRRPMAA
ncbi:MAG: hypothetical protein HYY78_02140 [Betaproteobacteria bacterium]|nr:hypothetical protein [Betaproteobacteria bacterium]